MGWMMRGALWFSGYMTLTLFPLVVAAVVAQDYGGGRPFLTQFGVACGFVALSIMALEYALVSKVRTLSGAFGQDALLQFHKLMGKLATALILVHAYLMIGSGYPVEWLNPVGSDVPWAMRWGVLASLALLLLMFLSIARKQIRLSYDRWQLSHGVLADAVILMGFVHLLMFGGFSTSPAMRALLVLYFAALLALAVRHRLIQPLRMWSRPWEVVENRPELGDSRTLVLAPVNHDGFTFEPGQFAWLSTGRTPFHKDRHPISISSCAYDEPGRPMSFTIRNLGDWSGSVVPALAPGRRVWVDGPHGVFSADRQQGMGFVLFGGGVGITPMRSICATLAERGDARPVILFFASRDADSLTFIDEFDELKTRLDLTVIPVLEHPPEGWTGERGFITKEIVQRYLPRHFHRYQYFICGPPPMMQAIETLLPEIGVPALRIQSEHFDMV